MPSGKRAISFTLWLLIWFGGLCALWAALVVGWLGRDEVQLDASSLTVRYTLGGLVWRRRRIEWPDVLGAHLSEAAPQPKGTKPSRLVIWTKGGAIELFAGLRAEQARPLLEEIEARRARAPATGVGRVLGDPSQ